MSPETRCIWHFADPPPESPADAVETLGGKGAALGRMTRTGLPVPAGFTISTEVCRIYQAAGQAALDSLRKPLREAVARIEQETGRPYAIGRQPLLLAIRGGARYSMPGMMVTLLNCGLTRNLVLAADESDATSSAFAKFIADFARCQRGIDLGAQVASARRARRVGSDIWSDMSSWSATRFQVIPGGNLSWPFVLSSSPGTAGVRRTTAACAASTIGQVRRSMCRPCFRRSCRVCCFRRTP